MSCDFLIHYNHFEPDVSSKNTTMIVVLYRVLYRVLHRVLHRVLYRVLYLA